MASLESLWDAALQNVAEHGVSLFSIFSDKDKPAFTYSIGLSQKDLPDLIIFGLRAEVSRQVLGDIARRLLDQPDSTDLQPAIMGVPLNDVLGGGMPVVLLEVPADVAGEYAHGARRFAQEGGHAFKLWQLVWPDNAGRLPWDEGFDQEFASIQPLIATTT